MLGDANQTRLLLVSLLLGLLSLCRSCCVLLANSCIYASVKLGRRFIHPWTISLRKEGAGGV